MPLMNAPFVLAEISAALQKLKDRGESRKLYLSQFPMTEEDTQYLTEFLSVGSVMIEHRDLSRTVWRETGFPGVWWGEYYDARMKLALRTIEIAPVPELALAQADDIAEAAERMNSSLEDAQAALAGRERA
jgi:hydrogenase-1 operon protein HyaF